jgi:hypothetical protein
MCEGVFIKLNVNDFVTFREPGDTINSAKFAVDRFSDFEVAAVQSSRSPTGTVNGPYYVIKAIGLLLHSFRLYSLVPSARCQQNNEILV